MMWTHLIIEAYCCYSYSHKKKGTYYDGYGNKIIKDNPCYNPSKRPLWCRNRNKTGKDLCPEFRCHSNGKNSKMCPFFGYTDANKKEYEMFFTELRKKYEEEKC